VNRPLLLVLVLAVLLVLTFVPGALAHGARCPVCGMSVDTHDAKWVTTWNGETYYFCMEADQKAFDADPEKYGGVLKLVRAVDGRGVSVVVRPRAPRPGDTCRLLVRVAPLGPDGMAPVESESLALRSAVARVWALDRARAPVGRAMHLQPSGDPTTHGLALLAEAALPRRVRLELVLRDGTPIVTHVDLPVSDRAPGKAEDHDRAGPEATTAPVESDHEATHDHPSKVVDADAPPDPDEPLTMEAQHQSMKVMARRWLQVGLVLESSEPDPAVALGRLEVLDGWRRAMPRFSLHKHADQKAEFDALTATFAERLAGLRDDVAARRWQTARATWRAIDANDCTRCHLKFRWAITPDLGAVPDLLGGTTHAH
jgi:YHS domain-containing protein